MIVVIKGFDNGLRPVTAVQAESPAEWQAMRKAASVLKECYDRRVGARMQHWVGATEGPQERRWAGQILVPTAEQATYLESAWEAVFVLWVPGKSKDPTPEEMDLVLGRLSTAIKAFRRLRLDPGPDCSTACQVAAAAATVDAWRGAGALTRAASSLEHAKLGMAERVGFAQADLEEALRARDKETAGPRSSEDRP